MKKLYALFFSVASIAAYAQCTTPTLSDVTGPEPICGGNTATLTAATDGETVKWFNAATGGTVVGTGTSFTTVPLNTTTTFYAEAQNSGGTGSTTSGGGKLAPSSTGGTTVTAVSKPWGLAFTATEDFVLNSVDVFLSSTTPGNIVLFLQDNNYATIQTITVAAPAGGTNSNPVQFTVPLNLTITGGNSYKLVVESCPAMIRDLGSNAFPFAIGTVGTITGGTINNSGGNSGVYYFLYNWNYTPGSAPCSSARQPVIVTVNPAPAAPSASSQTFCGSATVANLSATGTSLKWYDIANGGTELSADTALASGTYYVTQSNSICESQRTAVSVIVNAVPNAPTVSSQLFCGSATVGALQAAGTGVKWYTNETGGSALTSITPVTTGTYYASQTVASCESARIPVAITINPIPLAPNASAQSFCGDANVGDLMPNGGGMQWRLSQNGAALSPNAALVTGTYYVSNTINGCQSPFTSVTITVNATPGAPAGDEEQTVEEGATIADLEVTGTGLQWFANSLMTVPLPETTELQDGVTYYVAQMANGCPGPVLGVTVSFILGGNQPGMHNFTCFPNPVNDVLTITNTQPVTGVEAFTLLGQKVFSKTYNSQSVQIDLSTLAVGSYLLKVQTGNAVKNLSIIKK